MDDKILLTLGIITYNQPKELKRLLLSIMPQMRPGVEIAVNDNSRDSETELMVKKEFSSPYVRYFKNETNVKFDGNVVLATERALGKYVWWLGDEEVKPGAVAHILEILENNPEISLIWMNFVVFGQPTAARNFGQDKFFRDRNEVLEQISNELGFVSSIILDRDKALNADKKNMDKFLGLQFINVYLAMNVLSQEGKFYYVDYPYVVCHPAPPEKHTYNGFEIFGVDFYKIISNFKDKFDKKSVKKLLAKNFGHVWRGVLIGWFMGIDTPRGRFKTMAKLYWNYPEFYMAAPFFLLPKFVSRFFYFVYKKVFGLSYRPSSK